MIFLFFFLQERISLVKSITYCVSIDGSEHKRRHFAKDFAYGDSTETEEFNGFDEYEWESILHEISEYEHPKAYTSYSAIAPNVEEKENFAENWSILLSLPRSQAAQHHLQNIIRVISEHKRQIW